MGKRLFLILVLAALAVPATASAGRYVRPGWTGNLDAWLGGHMLQSSHWEPVDDLLEFGVAGDFRPVSWPVNLCVEGYLGQDEDQFTEADETVSRYTLDMGTLHLGIRKYFTYSEWVDPFLSGGLAALYMEQEFRDSRGNTLDDSLAGAGFFLGTGILFRPIPHFNVGLSGKWSYVPVEMKARDLDSNGGNVQFGVEFGYHW